MTIKTNILLGLGKNLGLKGRDLNLLVIVHQKENYKNCTKVLKQLLRVNAETLIKNVYKILTTKNVVK